MGSLFKRLLIFFFFENRAPGIDVHDYQVLSKRQREIQLGNLQRKGGVMLATYGLMATNYEQFPYFMAGPSFGFVKWKIVII